MVKKIIRTLHLEDDPADAELVQAKLAEADFDFRIIPVQTRDEFETALCTETVDIILADYRLPMYDGLSALRLARERYSDIPFIFVTGAMGEEAAIEALTQGATDYVLKQNLTRLPSAVGRALQEARNRRERKQAQAAQKASEARYVDLYENAPDMYMVVNAQTATIEQCNRTLAKALGRPKKEIIGSPVLDIYHPDCLNQAKEAFGKFLERGEIRHKELQLRNKDGSKLEISLNVSVVRTEDGTILFIRSSMRDITERKLAEQQVVKLSQAIEQSPVSIVITDVAGTIEFVNTRFTQITGYTSNEAIGRNPRILKSGQTPEAEYTRLWKTIGSGGTWQGEFHNRKKNGEVFLEHATIAPVRNAANVITHYVAVKEDITERKKLEEQFHQAQKMESVGRLAGGVAHDFNNMLGVILGRAEIALNMVDRDHPLFKHLQEILSAAERSANLTRQLLTFARKQTVTPKILDLNESMKNMLKLLRRLIGEDITLAWMPGEKLWPVKVDPSQIDQILANLCVNAKDAIAGIGQITIETQNTVFDATSCADHGGTAPGKYVMLVVSDNGCGMDRDTLDRLFEPFFTTKEMGKGTGLGLATVHGIVSQNKGFINVYSELGHGTTFRIYLPRHAADAQRMLKDIPALPTARGHETILLVEDESTFLEIVQLMLESMGYRVLTASTPSEAIPLAREQIHLLITDVIMPEMSGLDLAEKLTALIPGLRCLFISGFTDNVIAHHGVLDKGGTFLQKPFSKLALATKVREILDST